MANAASFPYGTTIYERFGAVSVGLPVRVAIWLMAALALATIGPEMLAHPKPYPVDFNYLWAAGKMWGQLTSPYAPQYNDFLSENGVSQFANERVPFFYPPHSFLLLTPLGLLPYKSASIVFTLTNIAALAGSSVLFSLLAKHYNAARTYLYPFLLHLGVLGACWNAGKIIFAYNAPMLITYLAVMVVIYGLAKGKSAFLIFGLVLALMKPQIGIALLIPILLSRKTRNDALAAITITGVASLTGLAPGGAYSLQAFLGNVSLYDSFYANLPQHTSGLGFLLYISTGIKVSGYVLLAMMITTITTCDILLKRYAPPGADMNITMIIVAITAACLFLPSHNNYYIVLIPITFWLSQSWRLSEAIIWAPATLALMRSWNIAFALEESGDKSLLFYISALDSIAVLALSIAILMKIRRTIQVGHTGQKHSFNQDCASHD